MERIVVALVCVFCGTPSSAQSPSSFEEQRLARYTTAGGPSAAELDPLQSIVTINFPRQQVLTVAHAIDYLLLRSGFRMGAIDQPEIGEILTLPLPEVHRRLGPYSVARALNVLVGEAFTLTVDPTRRRVSYTLRDATAQLATATSGSPSGLRASATLTPAADSLFRSAPGLRASSIPGASDGAQIQVAPIHQR
jgi:type IV pili sensor histidine kinase/response regulator